MTDENRNLGLVPYAEMSRSPAKAVLAKLEVKCRLKAELVAVQAELDAMVPALTSADLAELQAAMVQAVDTADEDVARLQAQVEQERRLSRTQNSMTIRVSRKTSALIGSEAEKRIARGAFFSAEALVQEACDLAYGGL